MLGKTAGGLYWMFRYLERSENTARLVDAGFRIALTHSSVAEDEWKSIVSTTGEKAAFAERHDHYTSANVVDFLLRDTTNPASVISMIEAARTNARMVRTALTREVWEATNECYMTLRSVLGQPIATRDLPQILQTIRQQGALVRGALHGTMLRNDIFNFARLGTFMERAESTARILDVKYYVLLPSVSFVGTSLDNVQWETILRSVSAATAYRWVHSGEPNARSIAEFLIFYEQVPRSLVFCHDKIDNNLGHLAREYGVRTPSCELSEGIRKRLDEQSIQDVFDAGLHEFLQGFIRENTGLSRQIEQDYRFNE
jgi:uncharacterized alpha-E superfamily protein